MSGDYCPPPTDRLCNCRQCRAEWEQREQDMQQFLADVLGIAYDPEQPVTGIADGTQP